MNIILIGTLEYKEDWCVYLCTHLFIHQIHRARYAHI